MTVCVIYCVVHLQVTDTPSIEGIVAWRVISKQILLRPKRTLFWIPEDPCIALHCIALHCIALHCIALHCIALHCIIFFVINDDNVFTKKMPHALTRLEPRMFLKRI
jgi:hypothetical protein